MKYIAQGLIVLFIVIIAASCLVVTVAFSSEQVGSPSMSSESSGDPTPTPPNPPPTNPPPDKPPGIR